LKSIAVTQLSGGSGCSTLAEHLAHASVCRNPHRVLWPVSLTDTSDIIAKYGFENFQEYSLKLSQLTPQATAYSIAIDIGRPDTREPVRLLPTDHKKDWILPVIPSLSADTQLANIESEVEWRRRVLTMLYDLEFDVIFDVGVPVPTRMVIHNDVFNFVDRIVVLVRYPWELEKLPKIFGGMASKTTVVLVGDAVAALRLETERKFPTVLTMPHNDKLAQTLEKVGFLTADGSRKSREYLSLLAELVAG
jgi:hypothetical protein